MAKRSRPDPTDAPPAPAAEELNGAAPFDPNASVDQVDTRYLETLVGYNARRAALTVIGLFVPRMAEYGLRPVDFSILSVIRHNPGITSKQLCSALNLLPPNLVGKIATLDQRGLLLRHPHLLAFIGRNYLPDEQGRWYFQNGPQRVYVELQSAPWILRVDSAAQHFATSTHTGVHVEAQFAVSDEAGHVYLATDAGLGLVHTIDMLHLAEALDTGHWRMVQCEAAKLPGRFGFVRSPWQDASTP